MRNIGVIDRARVAETEDEYRRLSEKHRKCDERLHALREKLLLSEEEKLEETQLKKQKLQIKDRMEVLARMRSGGDLPRSG